MICCCTGCCDTSNACASSVFQDDFNPPKAGYTTTVCPGGTGASFSGGLGTLVDNFPGTSPYLGCAGNFGRPITVPALNGLCISVSAQIVVLDRKQGGTTGIYIGGVGTMFGRYGSVSPSSTPYGTRNSADAHGCYPGSGTNHLYGPANTNFATGDCLCLVLKDTSAGAGQYSLTSFVNGVQMDQFTNQSYTLTPGGTLEIGLTDTNGGAWKNLCIATS